jgi:hypothetical protein
MKPQNITRADVLYDPDYHPLRIKELARSGADMETIARAFSVDLSVVLSWFTKHPECVEYYNDGRKPVDVLVEDALLRNALGSEIRHETIVEEDGPNGVTTRKTVKVTKTGGDVAAQKFWLSNRKKTDWGTVESTNAGIVINIGKDDASL